ncbi:MAG: DUF4347 domain-containing protein [Cyanobacteria bacterium P01_A01_bin.84]
MSISSSLKEPKFDNQYLHLNHTDTTLVIIDGNVNDIQALKADLKPDVDVLVLDTRYDGIYQISEVLKQYKDLSISSIHVVSHGSSGCLYLGNTQLKETTLERYTEQIRSWSQILQGKNVFLYGCQVAQGVLGKLFVQRLHQLTGANFAASSQRVGHTDFQGSWNLDTIIGDIRAQVIFSPQFQQTYTSYFQPEVNLSLNTSTVIESEGTFFSFNFNLSEPPPSGGVTVRLEGSIPQAINQWDVFQIQTQGLSGFPVDVSPGQDFSAFNVNIVEQNASISAPIFNDSQPDSPLTVTWTITPVSGGTVNSSANSATVTIYDDPSQVPSPPPDTPEPEPQPPNNRIEFQLFGRDDSSGENIIFTVTSTNESLSRNQLFTLADTNWDIEEVGDFDGNSQGDLLWRNSSDGQNAIWLEGRTDSGKSFLLPQIADTNWDIEGVGDINGNGRDDIIWRNDETGENGIWLEAQTDNGKAFSITTVADDDWDIVGVGDFDSNGRDDLLWRNDETGENGIWLEARTDSGKAFSITQVADTNWEVAGVGNIGGGGADDIIWYNSGSNQVGIWLEGRTDGDNAITLNQTIDNAEVIGIRDVTGNGKEDIIWGIDGGTYQVWEINGKDVNVINLFAPADTSGFDIAGIA